MHSLIIAAAFFVIVLSPCAAALWNGSDPSMMPVSKMKRAKVKRVEDIADEIDEFLAKDLRSKTSLSKGLLAKNLKARNLPVRNADSNKTWPEDPLPAVESQRRSILLKCARSNQFRHLHLHEFRMTADAASIVRLSVRR